jgi:hypothetical protein
MIKVLFCVSASTFKVWSHTRRSQSETTARKVTSASVLFHYHLRINVALTVIHHSHVLLTRFSFLFVRSFINLFEILSYRSASYAFKLVFVFRRSSFGLFEVTRSAALSYPGPSLHPAVDGVSSPRVVRRYYGSSDRQPFALSRANAIWAPPGTHSVSTTPSHRDWL